MKSTIRIAGAQIPVGSDIEANKKEIFKALDWAKENQVDHLLTPEASLSGYSSQWKLHYRQLSDSLTEIEDYQRNSGVGLHLGTYFKEREVGGDIFRNQIRHYNNNGDLIGTTNKTYVIKPDEGVIGRDIDTNLAGIPITPDKFAVGTICNDMYQKIFTEKDSIAHELVGKDVDGLRLVFHATNGRKFADNDYRSDAHFNYHNSIMHMSTIHNHIPILTVDSCTSWEWNGDEDMVNIFSTSSQSGVIDFSGWLTDVPRKGRQYFYYDLDISTTLEHKMIQYYNDNDLPTFGVF